MVKRRDQTEDSDVSRASRGDSEAAERVIAHWAPAIERYLRRNAGRRALGRESATDLAQSVCREALERLRRGEIDHRGDSALRSWLLGAADLKIKNRARYFGAQKRGEGAPLHDVGLEQVQAHDPSPSAALVLDEDRAAFRLALDQLDDRQREAVRLFHLEGKDHAAVAEELGITVNHSRTLVARALARLARHLRAS